MSDECPFCTGRVRAASVVNNAYHSNADFMGVRRRPPVWWRHPIRWLRWRLGR